MKQTTSASLSPNCRSDRQTRKTIAVRTQLPVTRFRLRIRRGALLAALLAAPALHAQIVADGATKSLSSATNVFASDLTIGTNGAFTLLLLAENTWLTNSLGGAIGLNSTARSNAVRLASASARWFVGGTLNIGSNGAFNSLTVSNGGRMTVGHDAILGRQVGASSNTVTVADPGTRWLVASNLFVGSNSIGNRLRINGGGVVTNGRAGILGYTAASSGNELVIADPGSVWRYHVILYAGLGGSGNRLTITNGGLAAGPYGVVGGNQGSSNNQAVVTGAGSVWLNQSDFHVGSFGHQNQLIVSAGGRLDNDFGYVGVNFSAQDNEVLITDSGSVWSNDNGLVVGRTASGNRLVLTNGGLARAGDYIIIGEYDVATSNSIVVDGGLLRVTNNAGAGVLDIRRGDCVLNAGLVDADTLRLTNVAGAFTFNGGVLAVKSTTSGVPLLVGDGVKSATLHLAGAGIHAFPGHPATAGVTVRSNATLTGGGIVQGRFVVAAGGTMSPGPAPGTLGNLTLADAVSPTLNGATIMEVSKSGAVSTNDNLQTLVTLSYGGVLTVTKLGPTALTPGDRFKLFTAPSYSGTFTALNLPPLGPGLSWTNRLLVDGSIEVIGALQPRLVGLTVAGPNVIITGTNGLAGTSYTVLTTTNAALPASSWVSLVTNQFGAAGGFGFTNPFTPLEPQRYFRLQTP